MKPAKPKQSALIRLFTIATFLAGCGPQGEQIPIHPRFPAALKSDSPGYRLLQERASHWEVRLKPLPDGEDEVQVVPAAQKSFTAALPPSDKKRWQLILRLFDRLANGRPRLTPILEGKATVEEANLRAGQPLEVLMHLKH